MKIVKNIDLSEFVYKKEDRYDLQHIHFFKNPGVLLATDSFSLGVNKVYYDDEEKELLPDGFRFHVDVYRKLKPAKDDTVVEVKISMKEINGQKLVFYLINGEYIVRPLIDEKLFAAPLMLVNGVKNVERGFMVGINPKQIERFGKECYISIDPDFSKPMVFVDSNNDFLGLSMPIKIPSNIDFKTATNCFTKYTQEEI